MKRGKQSRTRRSSPKHCLSLPDLDQARLAVLKSLPSKESQRGYRHAIDKFIAWYCSEPRYDSAAGPILVVDDDAALLKVIEAYLSRLGYRVDACAAAAAAWTLTDGNASRYAAVLVDLNMPGACGV